MWAAVCVDAVACNWHMGFAECVHAPPYPVPVLPVRSPLKAVNILQKMVAEISHNLHSADGQDAPRLIIPGLLATVQRAVLHTVAAYQARPDQDSLEAAELAAAQAAASALLPV